MRYKSAMPYSCKLAPTAIIFTRRSAMRLLGVLLLLTLTSGCGGNKADEAYNQYLTRLGRTLDVAPVALEPSRVPAIPPPRDLRLDIPPGNLGALDFLAISGCAVQVTIGKRNSSLGLMASASQRLLLDLEYLRLAPECIAYQRKQGNEELATTLEAAWQLKRGQLPALVFNATLGSSEYRQFWRSASVPGDYPANTSSAVIWALESVNEQVQAWLAGDFRADNQAFELLLSEVATGDGGVLLQTLAGEAAGLEAANRMLAQRKQRGPLCTPTLRPAAADILDNVVRKFFIAGIQPRAAALNRRYHELVPGIRELEQQLETQLPQPYKRWQQQRDRELAKLAQAPRQHVEVLQSVLEPCAKRPAA
jgi:hypothetical protein